MAVNGQEIWNGPYATDSFPVYAEPIPASSSQCNESTHPSSHLLSSLAKKFGIVLIGGSISERDSESGKIYNTCIVVNEKGEFIARHRKVHLFDINIPNKITFQESLTLSAGSTFTVADTTFGKIGVGICYDIRFAEYALICSQVYGVRAMIYPGISQPHIHSSLHFSLRWSD